MWTIINLDICLKGLATWEDQTRYLMVQLNLSISGTCSFLDVHFRDIPRSAISARSGPNALSVYICVVLKPHCRYILLTCLIPYSMFFTFWLLIIIPVVNITCRDMVSRKPIPLMCIRSHHRVTLLYLSSIPLGEFGTIIGSKYWILWRKFFPFKCGTLGPYFSSSVSTSSCRIGRLWKVLLSTVCSIQFTVCPMMFWNCLAISVIFKSREV